MTAHMLSGQSRDRPASPGSKGVSDGCEMLERHRRTECWPAPSITHAEQMTQFSLALYLSLSLATSLRVYQRCPEYLTGKRAHPWDLICTGVHLVEVVWDNLHIMSHLHPGFRKNGTLYSKRSVWSRPVRVQGGRGIVCRHCGEDQCVFALIHEAANASQLCKDLTCL